MTFYPRIIFLDILDKDKAKEYLLKINTLLDTTLIKEFVRLIEVKNLSEFGDLNSLMRTLKGNDYITLPGDDSTIQYNFINIIVTEKENDDEIVNLLNNIYDSTKFVGISNVNFYILISNRVFKGNSTIPYGSLGKIIIQKEDEVGKTIDDNVYGMILTNLILSLVIIPHHEDFINDIFNHNPSENLITIYPRLYRYPSEGYLEKIKEILFTEILKKIKNQNIDYKLDLNWLIPLNLFNEEIINLKDEAFFYNQKKIKIPLFATQGNRDLAIDVFIENYYKQREKVLTELLERIDIKRNDVNLIEEIKKIDESLYLKIKKILSNKFSLGSLLKALDELNKILSKNVKKDIKWFFLQYLKKPSVAGVPFKKIYLIIFLIIISLAIFFNLSLNIPLLSLLSLGIAAGYWPILLLVCLFYLKSKNDSINQSIYRDVINVRNFLEKNPLHFNYSVKNYLVHIIQKKLKKNIDNIEKLIKKYEVALAIYKNNDDSETDTEELVIDKINKLIDQGVDELFSSTLKKYNSEIMGEFKNPDVFIYYFLKTFSESELLKKIQEYLFSLNKNQFLDELKKVCKLPINTDQTTISKRVKVFIAKIEEPPKKDIIKIESAENFVMSILDVGVINE